MPTPSPPSFAELLRVAQDYADLFNRSPLDDVNHLIGDACVDPLWDDRTNLYSMLAEEPEDLALVLAADPEDYLVVRYVGQWLVDTDPVDWEELERALDPDLGGDEGD